MPACLRRRSVDEPLYPPFTLRCNSLVAVLICPSQLGTTTNLGVSYVTSPSLTVTDLPCRRLIASGRGLEYLHTNRVVTCRLNGMLHTLPVLWLAVQQKNSSSHIREGSVKPEYYGRSAPDRSAKLELPV